MRFHCSVTIIYFAAKAGEGCLPGFLDRLIKRKERGAAKLRAPRIFLQSGTDFIVKYINSGKQNMPQTACAV
ncbi:hypothetical protein DPQ22_09360 [Candidatus Tokpelaia sp.]|nr:hypothetical protein DPQ22_09360 [Candidatus Tokpelaia sp.]